MNVHWTETSIANAKPLPAAPPNRRARAQAAISLLLLVVAAGLVWYVAGQWDRWTGASRFQSTDDAFVSGDVTPLAAHVSGYVRRVYVRDFQQVHRGDLIATIDPTDYEGAVDFAKANLAAAHATFENLDNQREVQAALVRQAQATIEANDADVVRYQLEAKRQHDLLDRGTGTTQAVEQADANYKHVVAQRDQSRAQLDQQYALLRGIDIQQKQTGAQIKAGEAQVNLAESNLGYTRILAPDDGLVGQRQVRPGQFVNIGTKMITVVPMPFVWVVANFKETQMTNIRAGQSARVHIDAFPDRVFEGRVDSWSPGTGSAFALLPADNATGNFTKVVQRVPVKIVFDNKVFADNLVRPGMSVEATIDTLRQP